jgi:hypothetical protein
VAIVSALLFEIRSEAPSLKVPALIIVAPV